MIRLVITALLTFSALSAYSQLTYKGHVYAQQAGTSVHSANGKFLYIVHKSHLSVYQVDQVTGNLKRIQQFKTNFGGEISSPYLSADNRFLYSSLGKKKNGEMIRTFVMYAIDPNSGKLTFKKNFENDPEFQNDFVSHFSISPKGNLMFIGKEGSNSLGTYRLNARTGEPEHLNTYHTDIVQHFSEFHLSPDQRFLYIGGGNSHKQIVVYSFDENGGYLSKIQEVERVSHWSNSDQLVISADGKNVYQANGRDDEEILQFRRDPQTGMLNHQQTYTFKSKGKFIESHYLFGDRNTDFIYGLHAFGDGDAMHVIQRDPLTGNLKYRQSFYDQGATNRLNGVFQMSFSQNNRYVYPSGMWDGALNIFHNPEARKTIDFKPTATKPQPITTDPVDDMIELGFPTNDDPVVTSSTGETLSHKDVDRIMGQLKSEESDVTRLDKAFQLLEGKSVKVVQAVGLAYTFKSEYQRLQFIKFMSYFLRDPENKSLLADLFRYENMRAEVRRL